jgi:hypothetical protein
MFCKGLKGGASIRGFDADSTEIQVQVISETLEGFFSKWKLILIAQATTQSKDNNIPNAPSAEDAANPS